MKDARSWRQRLRPEEPCANLLEQTRRDRWQLKTVLTPHGLQNLFAQAKRGRWGQNFAADSSSKIAKRRGVSKRCVLAILASMILFAGCLSDLVWANSVEPPGLIVLVNHPPKDLSMVLRSAQGLVPANFRLLAWEGHYSFYSGQLKPQENYTVEVTTRGRSFRCQVGSLQMYNNIFTLDLSKETLRPGVSPLRPIILVSLRVFFTVIIEGMIFWLFGYRSKRSWMIFGILNGITQGTVNVLLNGGSLTYFAYLILALYMMESVVFVVEMVGFPLLLKEHSKKRAVAYAFVANLFSMFLGGFLIMTLPV